MLHFYPVAIKKNVMTLFCYGFQGETHLVAILRCSGFLVELQSYFVRGHRQGYESSLFGVETNTGFGLLTDMTHGLDTLCYDEQTVTWFFLFHFWTPPECMFVVFCACTYSCFFLASLLAGGGPIALQSGKGPILFC